ncbi:hypothetical protein GM415_04145 [Pseudodesulfovibrio cashew]|uniref:SPOR domain-containing protein n=1 Tax=Pseudodesulfovibrio cashew TaxID=2678688 RepID=A0A6I6JG13_9BACT|nr:SPOR domain-containing protein [Pseudodesulfovibrio cashew]QGY39342.1 hypothetical protein GM415_04145 [Pseudodesulfovibrio cashew]
MKFFPHRTALPILALALAALVLGGCFRKHIVSTPPSTRSTQPAPAAEARPAQQPEVKEETPEVIEETFVVDAPEIEAPAPLKEGDLGEESLPAAEAAQPAVPSEPSTKTVSAEPVQTETAAPVIMEEMYYVQVGAFTELDNANKVLADLIAQGYKGSKLSATGTGLYRVQAGAFADKAEAEEAMVRLSGDFPKVFVLKDKPGE